MKKRTSFTLVLSMAAALLLIVGGCSRKSQTFEQQRAEMVREQLEQRGIEDKSILNAFNSVPREEFVIPAYKDKAYDDLEAPIGHGESLDRPFENAVMLNALAIKPHDKVLEVGTGSGYLSALMSHLADKVFTIEIVPEIANEARERLKKLHFDNVEVLTGDGFLGWPEHAPFDAIVLAASPTRVPEPLAKQLVESGRLVLPLGGAEKFQLLVLYTKKNGKLIETAKLSPTTFVPMKGKILEQ
ncbi:MAG: protein-L-isoaspartate(D-aspartate) O-methyltransferase [Pseudomonadota bacterium]